MLQSDRHKKIHEKPFRHSSYVKWLLVYLFSREAEMARIVYLKKIHEKPSHLLRTFTAYIATDAKRYTKPIAHLYSVHATERQIQEKPIAHRTREAYCAPLQRTCYSATPTCSAFRKPTHHFGAFTPDYRSRLSTVVGPSVTHRSRLIT